jgi:protein Tex
MSSSAMNIQQDPIFPKFLDSLKNKTNIPIKKMTNLLQLLQEGSTIPFIVRYRQPLVENLSSDDCHLLKSQFHLFEKLIHLRNSRIEKLKRSEKFDETSEARLMNCLTLDELDEAYSLYKESTSTKIQKAKALPGLVDVANALLQNTSFTHTLQHSNEEFHHLLQWYLADAIAHSEIIADLLKSSSTSSSSSTTLSSSTFSSSSVFEKSVFLTVDEKKDSKNEETTIQKEERRKYQDYFSFSKSLHQISSHQILAIRRGKESADVLRLHFSLPDNEIRRLKQLISRAYDLPISPPSHPQFNSFKRHEIISLCIDDAVKRILIPMITRAAWRSALQAAEEDAIQIFCRNLKSLLLTPPLRSVLRTTRADESSDQIRTLASRVRNGTLIVLGIDPGFKQGHKVRRTSTPNHH